VFVDVHGDISTAGKVSAQCVFSLCTRFLADPLSFYKILTDLNGEPFRKKIYNQPPVKELRKWRFSTPKTFAHDFGIEGTLWSIGAHGGPWMDLITPALCVPLIMLHNLTNRSLSCRVKCMCILLVFPHLSAIFTTSHLQFFLVHMSCKLLDASWLAEFVWRWEIDAVCKLS
jgi:hypothetical protein